jgi:hypothetical protein
MSGEMLPSIGPHPYRTAASQLDVCEPQDVSSCTVLVATELFIIAWSLTRIAFCMVRGLDVEGIFALGVVMVAAYAVESSRRAP